MDRCKWNRYCVAGCQLHHSIDSYNNVWNHPWPISNRKQRERERERESEWLLANNKAIATQLKHFRTSKCLVIALALYVFFEIRMNSQQCVFICLIECEREWVHQFYLKWSQIRLHFEEWLLANSIIDLSYGTQQNPWNYWRSINSFRNHCSIQLAQDAVGWVLLMFVTLSNFIHILQTQKLAKLESKQQSNEDNVCMFQCMAHVKWNDPYRANAMQINLSNSTNEWVNNVEWWFSDGFLDVVASIANPYTMQTLLSFHLWKWM